VKTIIKLILFLLLSSLAYSKIITNSVTLSYLFEDKFYSYTEDTNISVVDESQNGDALSITKTAQYVDDNSTSKVEFNIVVTINRDISDLIIGDKIADGFIYQEGSLLLNDIAPANFLLLDSALSLSIGDVKEGEVYTLTYIARDSNKFNSKI
jgi:hypothetical protein